MSEKLPEGWRQSQKGNYYKKIGDEFLTVFRRKDRIGWGYVFCDEFCEDDFADHEDAIEAAEAEYGDS